MAKTGEICQQAGDYTGVCEQYKHQERASFTVGDTFTPCATCGGRHNKPGAVMNWTWVRR